ncbi:succinate dehydrogenase, cytochrome b556 subunit [Cardiobacteriaceae bacterium TAE3-ERU3]|nr:succinate dehydrogenase, cytochrome b556 subunit [Cardiobacteriaceae bacterium TAE3-ERU3]
MQQQNRPLSPHLQVYRPQFTSIMSILHRATGVTSAMGLLLITWWLAMTATGSDSWHTANSLFANPFVVLILFFWSGALIYHLCNGIRHLTWDTGKCLTIAESRKTARIVQIATVIITVALWIGIWW